MLCFSNWSRSRLRLVPWRTRVLQWTTESPAPAPTRPMRRKRRRTRYVVTVLCAVNRSGVGLSCSLNGALSLNPLALTFLSKCIVYVQCPVNLLSSSLCSVIIQNYYYYYIKTCWALHLSRWAPSTYQQQLYSAILCFQAHPLCSSCMQFWMNICSFWVSGILSALFSHYMAGTMWNAPVEPASHAGGV